MSDKKLANELAETARQLMVWLQDNELPDLPGLRGAGVYEPHGPSASATTTPATSQQSVALAAGVYRRVHFQNALFGRLAADGWDATENRRLLSLHLGVTHVLMFINPNDEHLLHPTRGRLPHNLILTVPKVPLTRPGALEVFEPLLDSLKPDEETLSNYPYVDFTSLQPRADLAWDDLDAAKLSEFRFTSIFDSETPRTAYEQHVDQILLLEELTGGNPTDEELARRAQAFHNHLRLRATYSPRTHKYRDDSGDYYRKWLAKVPRNLAQRKFLPTFLSNDYLRDNFQETLLKENETYLLIQTQGARVLYMLGSPKRDRSSKTQNLTVQKIWYAALYNATQKDNLAVTNPVPAVIFRAIEGADHVTGTPPRGSAPLKSLSGRFTYNYKAVLRWYFKDDKLSLGRDEQWLEVFVETFFADPVYEIDLTGRAINRDELFLNALRSDVADAEGTLKFRLSNLLDWYARKENANRGLLVKGSRLGERQIIGVTPEIGGQERYVFEWYPANGLVTRTALRQWLIDFEREQIFLELYRNTEGMLPFITLVTYGGVIVAGLGIAAPQLLGTLARGVIRQLIGNSITQRLTKKAVRKLIPQLIAIFVDGLLELIPRTDVRIFEFLRGVVHGFGAGAVEHYLTELDNRLEKQAKKLLKTAVNRATAGVYRAYSVYQKINAAYHKIMGVYKALKAVWSNAQAQKLVAALMLLGQHVGIAFVITLFIFVYLDYIHRSGLKEKKARDEWGKKQCEALRWMIRTSGEDIAQYAKDLHDEVAGTSAGPDVVRERNERLARKLADSLPSGLTMVNAVSELLSILLQEVGIENWEELKNMGFYDLLSKGYDAVLRAHPNLVEKELRSLGEAVGQLIGTIALERQILPEKWRKNDITSSKPFDEALRKTLAGGTLRAIWRLAMHPLNRLKKVLPALASDIRELRGEHHSVFEKAVREDTQYRDFLKDLMGDETELALLLNTLAKDDGLANRLSNLVKRVQEQSDLPPNVDKLIDEEDPLWPRDVMLFIMVTWLRFGLRQFLEAFALLEDSARFGGHFKLATLFEVAGLDVTLDDEMVKSLKVQFMRTKAA